VDSKEFLSQKLPNINHVAFQPPLWLYAKLDELRLGCFEPSASSALSKAIRKAQNQRPAGKSASIQHPQLC
jgi:hypothetical protein